MPMAEVSQSQPVAGVCAAATPNHPRRRRSDRLPDAAILLVEDEYWVAQTLARQIVEDGSTVVGPAPTPAAALELLAKTPGIGGAILDVRLGDETAFDIAEALLERHIPFVFFTGYDDISWPRHFRSSPKISKDADWRDLKRILFGPRARHKRQPRDFHDAVAAALPVLRDAARDLTGSSETGDRLVEQVLEIAIAHVEHRHDHPSVEAWLMSVLKTANAALESRPLN